MAAEVGMERLGQRPAAELPALFPVDRGPLGLAIEPDQLAIEFDSVMARDLVFRPRFDEGSEIVSLRASPEPRTPSDESTRCATACAALLRGQSQGLQDAMRR